MNLEVVRDLGGLEALREEWTALWDELGQLTPYNSWTWIWAWVHAKGIARRLFILAARDQAGKLLGIAPLQRVPLIVPGFGVLTFIGQETSISPDFVVKTGAEPEFGAALLAFISQQRTLTGLVLRLAPPVSGAAPLLEPTSGGPCPFISVEPYSERPIIALPRTYEDFLQGLGSKMRQELRAARKKLSARYSLNLSHEDRADFATRAQALFSLNYRRWRQDHQRGFYPELYRRLSQAGMLKIFLLQVDGIPAAGLSVLLTRETVFAELAGFDFDIDPRHLGKCFYGLVMEWCIIHGYKCFDFSSGSEDYKFRFKPKVYPKVKVILSASVVQRNLLQQSRRLNRYLGRFQEPAIL